MQLRTGHSQPAVFVLAAAFCLAVARPDAAQVATGQRPAPLPSLPATRLDDRPAAANLDAPRPLSLTFARPLPVRDVLLLLFRGTPFSVVVDPGVSATFAGELKNLTLRQALESVLRPAGLDYDVNGTVLRISPRRAQTRWFAVEHLAAPRAGLDYFADLGAGVQALLSEAGKYHVNRTASLLQVTDFADRLDLIAAYLDTIHIRASRQVRIQARFLEVARTDGTPIDWPALASRAGSGIRRVPGTAGWRVDDADAWLRTIAAEGAVRHIAAPSVLAMNNEPAILRADGAGGADDLRLTVTPQIAADRNIHLHVAPAYGDGRGVGGPAGDNGAGFSASFDTVVRIADGDTVIVGGLLRQRDAGRAEIVVVLSAAAVVLGAAR